MDRNLIGSGSDRDRIGLDRGRIGSGSDRIGSASDRIRIESGSDRNGSGSDGIGIVSDWVGVGSDQDRFGIGSDWIGSDRGRIGLGSARLGFGGRVRRYDFLSGRVRIGVGPIWLISNMLSQIRIDMKAKKRMISFFFKKIMKTK